MILATTQISKSSLADMPRAGARATTAVEPVVYFFLDFWNIALSAAHLAASHGDGIYNDRHVRLSFPNFRILVERNRQWGSGFAAAAVSNSCSGLRSQMSHAGIDLDVSEYGARSGREQNVDERIQLQMYRLLHTGSAPGIVVLASGDGAGYAEGRGYLPVLQALRRTGFAIEVMSWAHSFNRVLNDWVANNGRSIVLDPFYQELTFIDGSRPPATNRALSKKMAQLQLLSPNSR